MSWGEEFSLSKLDLVPLFHQQRDATPSHTENWQPPDRQAERDLGSFPVGTSPFYVGKKKEKWLKRT